MTGQHFLILPYNLIFEEFFTKILRIYAKIYSGLPIIQVARGFSSSHVLSFVISAVKPTACRSGVFPTEIKRLRMEQPIVFTVDIRYNKGIEFVSK